MTSWLLCPPQWIVLVVLFSALPMLGSASTCTGGSLYSDITNGTGLSNANGRWYLNTALPTTCSGKILNYNCNQLAAGASIALWTQEPNTRIYTKIQGSQVDCSAGVSLVSPTSDQVGAVSGSIIGVYVTNASVDSLVGNVSVSNSGVCTADGDSSSTVIAPCINDPNLLLRAEVNINIVDCGIPNDGGLTSVAGGTIIDNPLQDRTFGASVFYDCNSGRIATVGPTRTCQINGQWTARPECLLTHCNDKIVAPSNGMFTSTNDPDTATFSCNTGYTLTGSQSTTCVGNGGNAQWTNPFPVCDIVQCTDPGTPANSNRTGSTFTYGAEVSFTCNEGYVLSGSSILVCLSTGNWSSDISIVCVESNTPLSSSETVLVTPSTTNDVVSSPSSASYHENTILKSSSTPSSSDNPTLPSVSTQLTSPYSPTVTIGPGSNAGSNDALSVAIATVVVIVAVIASVVMAVAIFVAIRKFKGKKKAVLTINGCVYELSERGKSNADFIVASVDNAGYGVSMNNTAVNYQVYECIETEMTNEDAGIDNIVYRLPEQTASNTVYATTGPDADAFFESIAIYSDVPEDNETVDMLTEVYSDIPEIETDICIDPHSYEGLNNASAYEVPSESKRDIFLQLKKNGIPIIMIDNIKIHELLGSGQFGSVHRATWHQNDETVIDVAVKSLKPGATKNDTVKFLQEAAIMAQFKNTNVLRMFGVVAGKQDQLFLVVELLIKGDLHKFLNQMKRRNQEEQSNISSSTLLSFCRQVCLGMVYLSGKGFVHRDLAARNILLSDKNICKIADFGMSRDLANESYYVSEGGKIPVKWTAPEALSYKKYSTASDVWSFGCVLYEIWSVGVKPFVDYSNAEAISLVDEGYRLPPPPGCPRLMYEIMIQCWNPEPRDRPSFHDNMLVLLCEDASVYSIPEEDISSHPDAGTLGAELTAGEEMYRKLQKTYIMPNV